MAALLVDRMWSILSLFLLSIVWCHAQTIPPGAPRVPPTHTCRIVLRGATAGPSETFSLAEFSIDCRQLGGNSTAGGDVTVRLGWGLLNHINSGGGMPKVSGVSSEWRTIPRGVTKLDEESFIDSYFPYSYGDSPDDSGGPADSAGSPQGIEDWGIDILDAPHLQLLDSAISGVPLSNVNPLLQCLNCNLLTIQNLTMRNLQRRPSQSTLPYGAVRVTGLHDGVLDRISCSDVSGAMGWACILLQTQPSSSIVIRNSSFTNNAVERPVPGITAPPGQLESPPSLLTEEGVSRDSEPVIQQALRCTQQYDSLGTLNYKDDTQPGYGAVLIVTYLADQIACESTRKSTVWVENTIMDENVGGCGAGMAVVSATPHAGACANVHKGLMHLNFVNTVFAGNEAAVYGGGLYIWDFLGTMVDLDISGASSLSNNHAQIQGGAVALLSSSVGHLKVTDAAVLSNTAFSDSGGGLFVYTYFTISAITVRASNFSSNRAGTNGGAIYATSTFSNFGSVTISGASTLYNNSAERSGGAVYIDAVRNNITGIVLDQRSIVSANVAGEDGGAIYATSGENIGGLRLSDHSRLADNSVLNGGGGAVYFKAVRGAIGAFNIVGGEISNNSAFCDQTTLAADCGNGGGLYAQTTGAQNAITINAAAGPLAIFSNNTAQRRGGAMYFDCKSDCGSIAFYLHGGSFLGNSALTGNGGAICLWHRNANVSTLLISNSLLSGNAAACNGGGISMELWDRGQVTVNRASARGVVGSINITDSSVFIANSAGGRIDAGECSLRTVNSMADTSSGGAVYFAVNRLGLLTIAGESSFMNNNAASDGGAVSVSGQAAQAGLLITDRSVVSYNTAGYRGGFMLVDAGLWGGWGGESLTRELLIRLEAGSVAANNSAGNGGFAYINTPTSDTWAQGVQIQVADSKLTGNTAKISGGAVHLADANYFDFSVADGSMVAFNNATDGHGGAFHLSARLVRYLSISGASRVSWNWAKGNGGGISVTSYSHGVRRFTVDGASILQNNIAEAGKGGAIFIESTGNISSIHVAEQSLLMSNHAGADGGAVAVVLTSDRNEISTFSWVGMSKMSNNSANGRGGGLFVSTNVLSLIMLGGCSWNDNTAKDDGGAVFIGTEKDAATGNFVNVASTFTITGGSQVINNHARNGGAVYARGFLNISVIEESNISSNAADYDGGAVFLAQLPPSLLLHSCNIIGNIAERGSGGAFYLRTVEPFKEAANRCPFCALPLRIVKADVVNVSLIGNTAKAADGGAIYIRPHETCCSDTQIAFDINGCHFTRNKAMGAGGALALFDTSDASSTVRVTDSSFTGNTAGNVAGEFTSSVNFGGAITVWREPTDTTENLTALCALNVANTSFKANSCNGGIGGAVMLISCSSTFNGCNFTANRAALSGGAIASLHVPRTTASLGLATTGLASKAAGIITEQLQNTLVSRRRALLSDVSSSSSSSSLEAGLVIEHLEQPLPHQDRESASYSRSSSGQLQQVAAGGRRQLPEKNLCDSKSLTGAKWYVDLTKCHFEGNYADLEFGGALYLYASSKEGQAHITDSIFTENKAFSQHGGAVFLAAVGERTGVHLTGSVFDRNSADAASAGALYTLLGAGACGVLSNVTLTRNQAVTSGGACVLDIRSSGALDVQNITAEANSALTGDGGAMQLQVQTDGHVSLTDCSFNNNRAAGNGGAALLDGNCSSYLSLLNSSMARNQAGLSGGALYASYAAKVALATDGAAFEFFPAAIYGLAAACPDTSSEGQPMSIRQVKLHGNSAGQQGGAVFLAPACAATLSGLSMANNTACGGGGSLAALNCSAVVLRQSTISGSHTMGSGGAFHASGCRRVLFDYVEVSDNSAGVSGGAIIISGTPDVNSGSNNSSSSIGAGSGASFDYTSMILHRVRFSGNVAGQLVGASGGSCKQDSTLQYGAKGKGGGLFVTGKVVGALSRSDLVQSNQASFGPYIATTQRCYPDTTAPPETSRKIVDSAEMTLWADAWRELQMLAATQCWILQLSDTLLPPIALNSSSSSTTQNLTLWVEDFLASALHAQCVANLTARLDAENEAENGAFYGGIYRAVVQRLSDSRTKRIMNNATNFAVQLLPYVRNGTVNGSASDIDILSTKRFEQIATQLAACIVNSTSANQTTQTKAAVKTLPYLGLPPTYMALSLEDDVWYSDSRLQVQTGAPFNLTAHLYDMLNQRVTSDLGPSTITLALRARRPNTAANELWLDSSIANLDAGLNKSLTVPVINGSATWAAVKAYAWPGEYTLELTFSTNFESFVKVASREVAIEILPCAVGQTLDLSRTSYKPSWTGCKTCSAGQYGLWSDRRPALADVTLRNDDAAMLTLPGMNASAAEKDRQLLKQMNDTLYGDDNALCKTCPENSLCLGGAVIVPGEGHWHSAANSTRIHSCPNPTACSSPQGQGRWRYPEWLEEMGAQWDPRTKVLALCQIAWYSSVVPGERVLASYIQPPPPAFLNSSGDISGYISGDISGGSSSVVMLNRDATLWQQTFGDGETFNCAVFGLPQGDPDSYMQLQCLEGYTGNLCAACIPGYYVDSDFNCKRCPGLARTIALGLISFFSSVILVLFTTMTNFAEGFGEKKKKQQQVQAQEQKGQAVTKPGETAHPVELGDVVKVLVLHLQYLIIVTRLSVDYPGVILKCQAVFGAVTGAENYIVYSPSCLKPESDSAGQALMQWLAGILTPCAVVVVSMLLWTLRYAYPLRRMAGRALKNGLQSAWPALRRARRALLSWWRADTQSVVSSETSAPMMARQPIESCNVVGFPPALAAVAADSAPETQEGGIGLCHLYKDVHVVAFDLTADCSSIETDNTAAAASAAAAAAAAAPPVPAPAFPSAGADSAEAPPPPPLPLPTAASAALVVDLDGVLGDAPAGTPEPPDEESDEARDAEARQAAKLLLQSSRALDVNILPEERLDRLSDLRDVLGSTREVLNHAAAPAGGPPLYGTAAGMYGTADGIRIPGAPMTVLAGGGGGGGGSGAGRLDGGVGVGMPVPYYRHPYNGELWHRKTPKTLSHMRVANVNDAIKHKLHKLRTLAVNTQQAGQATFDQVDKAMSLREQLGVVLMAAVFILYPSWAHAALSTFACYPIDDGKGPFPEGQQATWLYGYWVRDMQMQCYSGAHLLVYVPIGVIAVLVFCVLPPLLSFLFVWRVRGRLEDPHVRKVYGFLYKRYKPRYIWWETVLQLETLILVTVEVLGRGLKVGSQALLLLIVFTIIAVFNVSCAPLLSKELVDMEFRSFIVLILTIMLSLFFVMDGGLNPATENAVAIIIITINVCFIAYFLHIASRHYWPSAVKKVAPKAQAMLRKISSIGSTAGNNQNNQHRLPPGCGGGPDAAAGGSGHQQQPQQGRFRWPPLLGRLAAWRQKPADSSSEAGGQPPSTSDTADSADVGAHAIERPSDGYCDGLSSRRHSDSAQLALATKGLGVDLARASFYCQGEGGDERQSSVSTEAAAARVGMYRAYGNDSYSGKTGSHVHIQLEDATLSARGGSGDGGGGSSGGSMGGARS